MNLSPDFQPADPPETRTIGLHVRHQPMGVLLIDDDPDCRMLIRDAIGERSEAYTIYEACNGPRHWNC